MNTNEAEKQVENEKIAKLLPSLFQKTSKGKGHVDRWAKAVYRPKSGSGGLVGDYAVRIMFQGRRVNFPLHTANKAAAAKKSADIYSHLASNGWEATLEKFKPKAEEPVKVATVGQLIEAVEKKSQANPRSLRQYASSMRLIAAEIAGIEGGKNRFAYRSPCFLEWRNKVDAVSLTSLSGEAVEAWRMERIAASKDPMKRKSAKVSANSIIRQAKALLSADLRKAIKDEIELPEPLPFAGVKLSKTKNRFVPSASAVQLFVAARSELGNAEEPPAVERRDKRGRRLPKPKITQVEAKREQWKAFALAILVGLRRGEVDTLTWRQLNLEEGQISIEETEYFSPKSEEGTRLIDLPQDALEIFRSIKASDPTPDPVFVLKGGEARPGSEYQYYRADVAPWQTWEGLLRWLRGKGIRSNKPFHEARKLAGSLITKKYGIEATRNFLGHSDIETTSNFYVDRREKVTVSMDLPEVDFAAEGKEIRPA